VRIAHVVTYLDKKRSYGGPLTVALGLAAEQASQGDQVHIVALTDSKTLGYQEIPSGISPHIFKVSRKPHSRKFSRLISLQALILASLISSLNEML
jgi:hypothetical protein